MAARVVSWSEISTFRRCPHQHKLQYIDRWTRPNQAGTAVNKGTLFHKAAEVYYLAMQRGMASPLTEALRELEDYRKIGADPDDIDNVIWMIEGYDEYWREEHKDWIILGVEERFQVPIRTPAGRLSGFILKGGIDLIIQMRSTGRIFVVDHKSCANLPKENGMDWEDQFAIYLWALRVSGRKVFGAIHNAVRRDRNKGDYPEIVAQWHADKQAGLKPGAQPKPQPLENRFGHIYMDRTKIELETIAQEALASARAAYSKANVHQRHPGGDQQCVRMCSYTEACLTGRKTGKPERETRFLLDVGFVQDFTRH